MVNIVALYHNTMAPVFFEYRLISLDLVAVALENVGLLDRVLHAYVVESYRRVSYSAVSRSSCAGGGSSRSGGSETSAPLS